MPEAIWEDFREEVTFNLFTGWAGKKKLDKKQSLRSRWTHSLTMTQSQSTCAYLLG